MRFDRIRLSNFKPFADADVRLHPGVTVIHGPNGSGKSSLLEACFFALYGTNPPFERNLAEVVTTGEEEARVELTFTHGGESYRLARELRATGERTQTASCVLETPAGPIEGVQDVEAHVRELLRMDAGAFVNCAYVRQGEINKLIEASPGERQDMIDGLLQLGRLETYRERASDARLAVGDLLGGREGRREQLDDQIEALESEDLTAELNELESERKSVEEELERYEENREAAEESLAEAEATLDEHAERREELERLEEAVADLRERIAETEGKREELEAEVAERRDRIDELDDVIAERLAATDLEAPDPEAIAERRSARESEREGLIGERDDVVSALQARRDEADRAEERADERAERAEEARSDAEEAEAEADSLTEEAEAIEERLGALEDEIEQRREPFADAPIEFGEAEDHLDALEEELADAREREAAAREELAAARSRVEEAESLIAAGKCPECGQPVEGSPHVEAIEEYRTTVEDREAALESVREDREALEARIERTEALAEAESAVAELANERDLAEERLEDRRAAAESARERAAERREAAAELEAAAEEAREAAVEAREAASARREELGELNRQQEDLKSRIEALESLADRVDERERLATEIDGLRERRSMLAEQNDERRETLAERLEAKRELEEAHDEGSIEAAREERERAEAYLEDVAERLSELDERRDELLGAIERTADRLDRLEELREERAALAETIEALASLESEAETVEAMYGDLRAELRQRNVARLEALLNETFELVYGNDAYARIELSPTYELTVYQKDDEALAPGQLSGGERALFNLSLRTAIYRLLGEGIEGAAPMPPLILDEPTVFLDSGHVSRLVDLVESMRELGVEQILVVSHDDDLVGAADDLLVVEKDPTSNRSTVGRAQSDSVEFGARAD